MKRFLSGLTITCCALTLGLMVGAPSPAAAQTACSPAYPDFCIPPPPPDLDCADIAYSNFTALAPDPHHLDEGGKPGVACETSGKPRFVASSTTVATTTTLATVATTTTLATTTPTTTPRVIAAVTTPTTTKPAVTPPPMPNTGSQSGDLGALGLGLIVFGGIALHFGPASRRRSARW